MRIADALLNKAEEVAFRELEAITDDNALRLFAKPRLSDVIRKGKAYLPQRVFDFYTRSHVDFVVADADSKPLIVVEYDGPTHTQPKQQERDRIKDALCVEAGLGILRINANHVTRLYRGMSVLRWIIEVTELEKWFYKAQADGQLPWDEPFDPAMIMHRGDGRRWPYWLSVSATQSINDYVASAGWSNCKGWAGIIGEDAQKNLHELSFLWFDNHVIWSETAIRRQNFEFPTYDLLNGIAVCELYLKLSSFRRGETHDITGAQFQQVCERFCRKYDSHPSHSHCFGSAPFNYSWNGSGWTFGPPRQASPRA
jgi:hypothetical protein